MDSHLTPYHWPTLQPGRGALIWGDSLRELTAAAAAWGAAQGKVLVVDAANRFDPYGLVREARTRGLPPREALSRVQVARAFTSHQLVRLIKEELAKELKPGCLVLVLGPVTLFYDEQVPLPERRRLFQEMVRLLAAVKAQAPLLLLQPRLSKDAPNRHFGRLLAPVVDYWVEMGNREEDHRGKVTRRLAPMTSASLLGPIAAGGNHASSSRPRKETLGELIFA